MRKIRVYATIKIKVTFTNWVKQTNYNRSLWSKLAIKSLRLFHVGCQTKDSGFFFDVVYRKLEPPSPKDRGLLFDI